MDFNTVINFLCSEPPVPPIPPNPGGGAETLNAQTGDAFAFLIAVLFAVFAMAFVAFKLIQRKRVCASVSSEVKHASGKLDFGGKTSTIIAVALAAISVVLIVGAISVQTTKALAESTATQNGPLSAPEKVDAVVDSDTGKVTIEEFVVSNTDAETPFYKFNTVTATLEGGIDDGDCNWDVYLSNSEDIAESDIVYSGKATGSAQALENPRYIESNGVTHIRIETNIDPDIAKTFHNTKVLNLKFDYLVETNVEQANLDLDIESGYIEGEAQRPVVGAVAKLYVDSQDNTKLSIFDGCHWYDYNAIADEGFQLGYWTLNGTQVEPGQEYNITADSTISALFVGKTAVLTYDANGGIETAPKPYIGHIGNLVALATYGGTSQGGSKATGWNTKQDGTGFHYVFGSTFVLNEEAVTLYADWTNASFKALWDNDNKELSFVYDKTTDYPKGIQVISLNDEDGNPKTDFSNMQSWGDDINKIRSYVKAVVIEDSVKAISLEKVNYMFAEMSSLENISGLENLNWITIHSAESMFSKLNKLEEITLPKGIFANVPGNSNCAFQNCSLTKIVNQAPICFKGMPIRFDSFWANYRPWLNQETNKPILDNEPLPAGTFITNTITWTDEKIGSVKGSQGEGEYFTDTDLESGKAIPSWVNKIIVKHTDTSLEDYTIKVTGKTFDGKDFKYYFDYDENTGGALIDLPSNIDCFTSNFNVEIFVPDDKHRVTANFENSNIADDELFEYFLKDDSQWTKNPEKDNEFYADVTHGATAGHILFALPRTGVTSKANNPYNMDNEKTFKEWGNDKDYSSADVIFEDVTFTPKYDYIVQVLTVPCSTENIPQSFTAWLQMTLQWEDDPDDVYDMPGGGALSFREDKPMSCTLNGNVIEVDCFMYGENLHVLLEPHVIEAQKSLYTFSNWIFIDSSGVPKILKDKESFEINSVAKLIASFMPADIPNLSTVKLAIPNLINVENAPAGWVAAAPGERATVYTKADVPLGTPYASLQKDWENTKFSITGFSAEFKMTGWLLDTYCYSASGNPPQPVSSKQLLSDNDIVTGATNTVNAKMCYSVDFESNEHAPFNTDKLFIPLDLADGGNTRISADEDNYIYFNLRGMKKPVIADDRASLDFDETLVVKADVKPGSFVKCWELYRYGLPEPTIITQTTDTWIDKNNPIQKIVLKTTSERPVVKVDLGEGTVRDGWEPEGWTKDATGHVYTKAVDGGTTFEMALRDWSLIDQRTECGDKVFSSWTLPEGKDINSIIENNDSIDAQWAQMVDIPLHSKYPYLFAFSNNQVSFPFENLKNVELAKNKYGANFLIFRLSNDSTIEMEISNVSHHLDDLSGVRVYYYDKQNYKKAVFIPTGGNLLAALGGRQSIFDEISSFIRFDIYVAEEQLLTLGKECGKAEVISSSPGIDVEPSDTIDDTESFLLLREDDQSATYRVEEESEGKLRLWLRDLFTGYEEYFTLIPEGDISGYWTYQYERITDWSPHEITQLPDWQTHLFQAYAETQNDSCDMPGLQDQHPQNNFDDASFPQDCGANSGAAALFAAGPALAFFGLRKRS